MTPTAAPPRPRRYQTGAYDHAGRRRLKAPCTRRSVPRPPAPRTELARYTISSGTRLLVRYGAPGAGSLWDEPADGDGKRYLVEPRVDLVSLPYLLADYLEQSRLRDCPAMVVDLGPGEDLPRRCWPPSASLAA